ncbi:MAG: hypothetical protein OEY33_05170 [Bdellovibrionales bacterium]|jgi:lipoprotein-releasing system permease protein|nr:hypothetical protein [Bdellovibrionales bacterium]
MLGQFFKYFFSYIFRAKTRQKLLFLAFVGLFLSSFCLLVLQSSMGGLQRNLMERSKNVTGYTTIKLKDNKAKEYEKLFKKLKDLRLRPQKELEVELLIKKGAYITPLILHGIDTDSIEVPFLKNTTLQELILPYDLAYKIQAMAGDQVQIISPGHVDYFLGELPRSQSLVIDDLIETKVPEVDLLHGYTRLRVLQNLIREKVINKIVLYAPIKADLLKKELKGLDVEIVSWEEKNKNLVWALGIESTVMIFLFVCMALLVSLCITSGLMVFFNKIKTDLASFWILGASKNDLERCSKIFLILISILACGLGIVFSLIFLFVFDYYAPNIMPDIFVDRKIPIFITLEGILISFFIPTFISVTFSYMTLGHFTRNSESLFEQIKAYG